MKMSPEGAAHGIQEYIKALKTQAQVAELFYLGKIGEGIDGLLHLPDDVRLKIDQLIWDLADGEAIDPTDPKSGELIADAVLFSLEERMGMHG
jgi:hypothetical protein